MEEIKTLFSLVPELENILWFVKKVRNAKCAPRVGQVKKTR